MSCTRTFRWALLVISLCGIAACNESRQHKSSVAEKKVIASSGGELFSEEEFERQLAASLHPVDTLDSTFRKRGINLSNALPYTYGRAGYAPLWITASGVTEAAAQLVGELDSLQWDGLDPERYHHHDLEAMLGQIKDGKATLQAAVTFDTTCTRSYLLASHDLLLGRIRPQQADDQWFHANDSLWMAPAALYNSLNRDARYTSLDSFRSLLGTYRMLRGEYRRYQALAGNGALSALQSRLNEHAVPGDSTVQKIIAQELPWARPVAGDSLDDAHQMVRQFQEYNGLAPTGKTDSLTVRALARSADTVLGMLGANLERLRWLPRNFEAQYVLVNIPLMELYYRKGGENAFNMRVVVGKPSRQTPVLNADMANVVFSPPWGVPPTILKKDVLPGIARRGGSYLARKGLKAYDRRGKMVSASAINAKNYRSFSFRQPPGARNALGEVKFNLPNKWDIYLHDTPHREDFPRRYRAKSSGCVRVERPRDFAEFILKDIEGRNFDQVIIDSIIQTRHTRYEQLSRKIPVHILYLTAFEDSTGEHLRLLGDIYHRDAQLMAALQR